MKDIFGRTLQMGDLVVKANENLSSLPYGIVISDTNMFRVYNATSQHSSNIIYDNARCESVYKIENPCEVEQVWYDRLLEEYHKYEHKKVIENLKKKEQLKLERQEAKKFVYNVGDVLYERKPSSFNPDRYLYLGYIRITDSTGVYNGYGYIRFNNVAWRDFQKSVLGVSNNSISLLDAFYFQYHKERHYCKDKNKNILTSYTFSLLKNKSRKFNNIDIHIDIEDTICEFNYSNYDISSLHERIEMIPEK
jgi:hypothetical protein